MKDSSNFTTRLQKLLSYYELSASGLATKIGVQRSSISHIISGRNKPSLDFITKLLAAFDEVSFDWIINGKGSFPKSNTPPPVSKPSANLFSETESKIEQPLSENSITEPEVEKVASLPLSDSHKIIDKIILLYKDGSFDSYQK